VVEYTHIPYETKKQHLEDRTVSRIAHFSRNLRRIRALRGLTQRTLGERLGFSEKTVSKWECGAAIPDVETLFSLCEILQTTVEALFSDGLRYFLGIDGGGTKTALMLADEEGRILRTHRADACNPVDIGMENAQRILKDAIFEVCRGIPLSSVCMFAGIAGGSSGDTKERLYSFFKQFGFAAFENDSDNRSIIAAGLGDADGITVILGTGFCVYTQKGGKHHRIGGWGYLIDDGGSGYNLGRDALHAYFSAYDGTGEKTLLTEEIDRIRAGGVEGLITYVYGNGKKAVASMTPAVIAAHRRGDTVATAILERNMEEAARVIACASREFDGASVPVILAGGLTNEACVLECLCDKLSGIGIDRIEILACEPVVGALMLAKKQKGEEL